MFAPPTTTAAPTTTGVTRPLRVCLNECFSVADGPCGAPCEPDPVRWIAALSGLREKFLRRWPSPDGISKIRQKIGRCRCLRCSNT
jgi:hypothetical protein